MTTFSAEIFVGTSRGYYEVKAIIKCNKVGVNHINNIVIEAISVTLLLAHRFLIKGLTMIACAFKFVSFEQLNPDQPSALFNQRKLV